MKPTKDDIQKWCEALRSGKYNQGHQTLQSTTGFCCLGVACIEFIPKSELLIREETKQ